MLSFTSNLKIYLFKNRQQVSFSIKVSDNCVNSYWLSTNDFEKILSTWNTTGFDAQAGNGWWSVQHKKSTPRPESAPTSYVRISVSMNNQTFHLLDLAKIINLGEGFFLLSNLVYLLNLLGETF